MVGLTLLEVIPPFAKLCLGTWEQGWIGWLAGQACGTSKSISTQPCIRPPAPPCCIFWFHIFSRFEININYCRVNFCFELRIIYSLQIPRTTLPLQYMRNGRTQGYQEQTKDGPNSRFYVTLLWDTTTTIPRQARQEEYSILPELGVLFLPGWPGGGGIPTWNLRLVIPGGCHQAKKESPGRMEFDSRSASNPVNFSHLRSRISLD